MKIHFFGTCSGTLPQAGRHHTSFALEDADHLYWFDAGECCSYTAYLMGTDLMKTKAVFISHCHMDHVGGLGNLLWNIRKAAVSRHDDRLNGKVIDIFLPVTSTYDGIMQMLANTEGRLRLFPQPQFTQG